MVILAIIEWVVVGLVIGFIASKVVNLRGDDPRLGVIAAVAGAIVAAAIYTFMAGAGMGAWRPWTLAYAAGGAVIGAVMWHGLRSRYVSHDRYVPRSSY